jgi:hypothetical protein
VRPRRQGVPACGPSTSLLEGLFGGFAEDEPSTSMHRRPFVAAARERHPLVLLELSAICCEEAQRWRAAAEGVASAWVASMGTPSLNVGVARMRAVNQCQVSWVPSGHGSSPSNKRLERAGMRLRLRATGAGRQCAPAALDRPRGSGLEGFVRPERGLTPRPAAQAHR